MAQSTEFQAELARKKVPGFEEAFYSKHGISLTEFLNFLAAVYVRFLGNHLETNLNPLLLDLANDESAKAFTADVREKATALISQTPEELAVRLVRARQSWAFDMTPIRERPLLEVMPGKYCCPDLTLFVRTFIDRVYFLLQDAYGKDTFNDLMGTLFECYVHRLLGECTVTTGLGRTYCASSRFVGKQQEAGDGILVWSNTAVVFECKARLLTTRERMSGISGEILQGVETIAAQEFRKGRKGVGQLARNIARILGDETKVVCQGHILDLVACRRIYPVLVCLEEALGTHAVQKMLQPLFDAEYARAGGCIDRVGPLMVLTVRDLEALAIAGQFVSIEKVFNDYAQHLLSQPKDHTGSFQSVLRHKYGATVKWEESLTFREHREMLEELVPRFSSPTQDD